MNDNNGDCYVIFFCVVVLVLGLAAGVLLHLAKQEEARDKERAMAAQTQVSVSITEKEEAEETTRSEQYIKIDPETTPEPSYGKDARPTIDPSGPLPVQPEPSYDWRVPEPAPPRIG